MKSILLAAVAALFAGALSAAAPSDSLYQLDATLVTQNSTAVRLDVDRGHPTVVAMFYAGCHYVCPAIISGIQHYEQALEPASRERLRVLMISLDAERDMPPLLQALAQQHHADPERWIFARADAAEVRRIAGLLDVRYRRLPDGDYDHAVRITLLDGDGRIVAQTDRLAGDEGFAARLAAALR